MVRATTSWIEQVEHRGVTAMGRTMCWMGSSLALRVHVGPLTSPWFEKLPREDVIPLAALLAGLENCCWHSHRSTESKAVVQSRRVGAVVLTCCNGVAVRKVRHSAFRKHVTEFVWCSANKSCHMLPDTGLRGLRMAGTMRGVSLDDTGKIHVAYYVTECRTKCQWGIFLLHDTAGRRA